MQIGYTMGKGRGDTDQLLAGVAQRLADHGTHLCGTVQTNTECEPNGPCDMDVHILPNGPTIRISQSLGRNAKGCRLDPGALETAIAACEITLPASDALIVNKFGKQEAAGRGFRNLIAEAIAREIPVLVGLNALNKDAFLEFVGGAADEIAPKPEALLSWLQAALETQ